jgi:hypothetical protein
MSLRQLIPSIEAWTEHFSISIMALGPDMSKGLC